MALGVIFIPIFLDRQSDNAALTIDDQVLPVDEPNRDDQASGFSSRVQPIDRELIRQLDEKLNAPAEDLRFKDPSEKDEGSTSVAELLDEAPENESATPRTGVSAWALQLGSFASDGNASTLMSKLKESGHPAYIDESSENGTPAYRVRVGPILERQAVETLQQQLNKDFDIKGIIIRYP